MTTTHHTPAPFTSRSPSRRLRLALVAAGTLSLLASTGPDAFAQDAAERDRPWEFLISSGAVVPTGAQRDVIKRGNLTAAQLTYVVRPSVAVTATLGWGRSRDITLQDQPKLDVFTYDVGAELRAGTIGGAFGFRPFLGAGAGARSYDYRKLEMDATHNLAVYGSAGGELGAGRVRVRLEVRDYLTGFKPLDGVGASDRRNDVVMLAGLRITRG